MIPLFKPPVLTGKYMKEVLNSRHLVTGPMVERLRDAVAKEFHWEPEQVVLGNTATHCFEALLIHLGYPEAKLYPRATWPLIRVRVEGGPSCAPTTVLLTDIGGDTAYVRDFPNRKVVLDCSHSWEPSKVADYSFASFSPIKLVCGPQGGAMFCKSSGAATELQTILNYGFESGPQGGRDWTAWDVRGIRGGMSDVHAALNLEALGLLAWARQGYREITQAVAADLYGRRGVRSDQIRRGKYLLQLKVRSVPRALKQLRELGVQGGWHFPPAKLLTVPAWPGMVGHEVCKVGRAAAKVLRREWS